MTNLFIKTEYLKKSTRREINLDALERSDVSAVNPVLYPVPIYIERIKPVTGSTKTKKIYSVVELDEIMLRLFGCKIKTSNGKEATVSFLTQPENILIIQRHNERLREVTREQSRREIKETPR